MFTGLVETTGLVRGLEHSASGGLLRVAAPLGRELDSGDSVAVNGVCLTVTEAGGDAFAADVMAETLRRSALGALRGGEGVNLELPLRAADRLGGHIVQGHVDGVGTVAALEDDGLARLLRVSAPASLLRYVVEKGSIAVDGVSLTVAAVDSEGFVASLIPETVERTTLGALVPGRAVNVEVDVLAKYVEKLIGRAGVERSSAEAGEVAERA